MSIVSLCALVSKTFIMNKQRNRFRTKIVCKNMKKRQHPSRRARHATIHPTLPTKNIIFSSKITNYSTFSTVSRLPQCPPNESPPKFFIFINHIFLPLSTITARPTGNNGREARPTNTPTVFSIRKKCHARYFVKYRFQTFSRISEWNKTKRFRTRQRRENVCPYLNFRPHSCRVQRIWGT